MLLTGPVAASPTGVTRGEPTMRSACWHLLTILLVSGLGCGSATPPRKPPPCDLSFATSFAFAEGIEGQPVTVEVVQPVARCGLEPAEVRVVASVIAPSNTPFEDVRVDFAPYDPSNGSSSAKVTFTPSMAGTWQVIATFEPSLGRVQLPVEVAQNRSKTPRTSIELPFSPNECVGQPWRTTAGTVLCSRQGIVEVAPHGVFDERSSFRGAVLSVLGNTVWSSTQEVLTRRIDTGERLEVVAQIDRFSTFGPSYSDETEVAEYDTGSASVNRLVFADGGLTQQNVSSSSSVSQVTGLFLDGPDIVVTFGESFKSARLCVIGAADCMTLTSMWVSHSTDALWEQAANGSVTMHALPLSEHRVRTFTMPQGWRPRYHSTSTSREALILDRPMGSPSLIGSVQDDSFIGRYYGEGPLLGAQGDSIVLQEPGWHVTFADP